MKDIKQDKILDIIIPAFNSHDTIQRTLGSILIQSILPLIKVSIVNDGGEGYKDVIEKFSSYMDINEITLEKNYGPGMARQIGIDKTHCKYIMFCDSDDLIGGDCFALELMINQMESTECDMLVGSFIDQRYDRDLNQFFNFTVSKDLIWMHGKIYNRKSLKHHNIKFKPDLRNNEDSYFNYTCYSRFSNIEFTDIIAYTWLYRPNSITNSDDYDIMGYQGWYQSLIYHLNECKELYKSKKYQDRITPEYINYNVAHGLVMGYLEYTEFYHKYSNKLCETFLGFLDFYYKDIFRETYQENDLSGFLEASYFTSKNADGRNFIHPPIMGLDQFIKMLEDRYQKNIK